MIHSYKTIENDKFKVKLGTINRKNPSVVYVECGGYITPTIDKDDYENDAFLLRKNFNKNLRDNLLTSPLFENKFICDFDIRTSGLKKNKKSFVSIQYHLRQPVDNVLSLDLLKEKSEDLINNVLESFNEDLISHNFKICKNKR